MLDIEQIFFVRRQMWSGSWIGNGTFGTFVHFFHQELQSVLDFQNNGIIELQWALEI